MENEDKLLILSLNILSTDRFYHIEVNGDVKQTMKPAQG